MRVGVAGAGRIGEVHVRNLAQHAAVSEVRLFDPDPSRVAAVAAAEGAVPVTSMAELLVGADAVVIASPTQTHADLLDRAMAAGLPAFCEKPVAAHLGEIQALAGRAERCGHRVQVGFHYRFDPALRALASSITGPPRLLRVHSTTEFAPSAEYLAGAGGLVADKLIHELDMIRWLGGAAVTTVAAFGAEDDEPMTAGLLLRLADGGLANVWGGYRSVAGFDLTVEVETADTVLVIGSRRPSVEGVASVPPSRVVDFRDRFASAYRAELDAFLAFARGECPNPCSLEEAVQTQLLVVAAQMALREHRIVEVGELR